jgi:hypothetical protein
MLRRSILLALVPVLALAACGDDCDSPCKGGITFYVADVTGALAPGTREQLRICFDDSCKDVTVSRAESGPTVFLAFGGAGGKDDHTITVTGTGSLQGEYTGPLSWFTQQPDGKSCASCQIGAVKISADGTLTPGEAVPPVTAPPTTSAATAAGTGTTGG